MAISDFTLEELQEIIENAKSFSDANRKLGYTSTGGSNIRRIRKLANDNNWTAPYLEKPKMKRGKERIGERYEYLEIIDAHDGFLWCKCHCCNRPDLIKIDNSNWKRQKSCGCIINTGIRREDLTGQIFQNLKVISYNEEESKKHNRVYWNCECLLCHSQCVHSASHLRDGHACSCGCIKRRSRGEEKVYQILQKMNLNFKQEYSFSDLIWEKRPMRFDFAIFENNKLKYLLEYQGKQHYYGEFYTPLKIVQERGLKKKEYCDKNNIPLIEIPYTDFDKIDTEYLLNKFNEVK